MSYLFGDILTEVYGFRRARRVIWAGFAATALLAAVLAVVGALPPAGDWPHQEAYRSILGQTPRIVAGSLVAYFAGEFSNSYVLSRMKVATGGRWLFARTIGSTLVGEGVDTLLFVLVAFAGTMPAALLRDVALSNYVFKVGVEVLATPATYAVVRRLHSLQGKRALVCGSTQGIGRAAALELASRGAAVTLFARDPLALERVRAELPGAGHTVRAFTSNAAPSTVPPPRRRCAVHGAEAAGSAVFRRALASTVSPGISATPARGRPTPRMAAVTARSSHQGSTRCGWPSRAPEPPARRASGWRSPRTHGSSRPVSRGAISTSRRGCCWRCATRSVRRPGWSSACAPRASSGAPTPPGWRSSTPSCDGS